MAVISRGTKPMNGTKKEKRSEILDILNQCYASVFYQNWPFWLGGLLIGILSVFTFAWARPWGVAGGLKYWGDAFFALAGVYQSTPDSPLFAGGPVLTLGLLWGAFGSALLSKQFALRKAPPLELVKGAAGGALMGVGAAMAKGCNVGGFYAAVSAMSIGGLSMMVGLILGSYLGLKFLYWELEHFSPQQGGFQKAEGNSREGINWSALAPFLGLLVMLSALVAMYYYTRHAYTQTGGLLLFGLTFGVIIQRSRFCFVRCFRDPFMTGEGEMARAVSMSIIISLLGFAILKWTGLRGEMVYVARSFWMGSLIGGIIFGFGMVIAGGCGSGAIWRAGEGQLKLIFCLVTFALTTSLFSSWVKTSPGFARMLGNRAFLPEYLSYGWSLALLLLVFSFLALLVTWNERTGKFTIDY